MSAFALEPPGEPLSFEEMLAVLGEAEQTLNRP